MPPLPGQITNYDSGEPCEDCQSTATHRIIGETDSHGHESHFLCDICTDKFREATKKTDKSGHCDWCKGFKPTIKPHRDFEEGSNGPVYDVCTDCIRKEVEELEGE